MDFTGPVFISLLMLLFALHWLIPQRLRPLLLLGGSYFFYAWWDLRFIAVLLLSTALDFSMAILIGNQKNSSRRLALLTISVTANLTILFFFKYANFFLSGIDSVLDVLSPQHSPLGPLSIFVPLGVSFYTFHSISYVVDIYRERVKPCRSIIEYALYVSYFPKLIAGPIERTENFVPQLEEKRAITLPIFIQALRLMAMGYFLKLCVGDRLSLVTESVFKNPEWYPPSTLWTALYGFSLQIYGDFWGYSLIAQGASLLFAIRLSENFLSPYLAANPQEFWRRWHVSLSTWFRDYVYKPLGGNRRSERVMAFNLVLTMVLAGLWHGASLNFLLWGLYHGLLLVIYRSIRWPGFPRFLGIFFTFHLVAFGWILFKAPDLLSAGRFFIRLFNSNLGLGTFSPPDVISAGAPLSLGIVIVTWIVAKALIGIHDAIYKGIDQPISWRSIFCGLPLGLLLILTIITGASNAKPFVYFHF